MPTHQTLGGVVRDAVIGGIRDANADYERLSDEWVSERGVESFVAGRVATRLRRYRSLGISRILLEVTVAEILEYSPRKFTRGRRGIVLQSQNRIDVVALNSDGHAIGIVELKRSEHFESWRRDIVRISTLLNRLGCLRFSCFAGFLAEREGKRWVGGMASQIDKTSKREEMRKHLNREPIVRRSRWVRAEDDRWRNVILGCVFTR